MRIILFRHGPAGSADPGRWPDDGLRPLTPRGVERTRAAAQGFASLVEDAVLILTSPLTRAEETAKIVSEELGIDRMERHDLLAPGAPTRKIIDAVSKLGAEETIILVGHEPDLGLLAGTLIGAPAAMPIKKAGACSIVFDGTVAAGRGRLQWFVPPRILRRIGSRSPEADRSPKA